MMTAANASKAPLTNLPPEGGEDKERTSADSSNAPHTSLPPEGGEDKEWT